MMGIKIIRTKTWKKMQADKEKMQADKEKMQADMDELCGAYKNLHELQKGLYQKYLTETNKLGDTLKQRDVEIEELKKKLRRAEHEKAEAFKKLKKNKENKKA